MPRQALTPDQEHILRTILKVGQQRGASPKEIKAAVETGLVESNLSNPTGGTGDSAGWRQERASLYRDPTNLVASINRFFDETGAVKGQYGRAGDLAAAVQRPAAAYRGRYQEHSGEASSLLAGTPAATAARVSRTTTRTTPGVDRSGERRALILNWLQQKGRPGALTELATGLQESQDTPGRTVTTSSGTASQGSTVAALKAEADKINAAHVPYQWGGGHQARAASNSPVAPLDCSGAVSRVLGINPRVSGQFQSWGKSGDGGSSGVTVYSNNKHVFMKINGHFFGTSATNPGGGAGWIPQGAISSEYLRGFTARHL